VLKAEFAVQMEGILGPEWPDFLRATQMSAPLSIRVNAAKWTGPKNHDGQVAWCAQGFYLAQRPVFTLDPRWHAGAYYVQEASSMVIGEALRQTIKLDQPIVALDLAAAPGGKSTLVAGMLSADSFLLANEVIRSRYQILRQNLVRWGYPNVAISNHDPADFSALAGFFDLILVDAPCSGEGLFRKDPHAMEEWSPEQAAFCAARQRRILADAAKLLTPGGVMIYSTCTYNHEENSQNVAWIQAQTDLEYLPLVFPEKMGVQEMAGGYQCFPHKVRGEGFFLACLRKPGRSVHQFSPNGVKPKISRSVDILGPWVKGPEDFQFLEVGNNQFYAIPARQTRIFEEISGALRRVEPILELGTIKHGELIPAHALALSTALNPSIPAVELDSAQAVRFLRKEDPALCDIPKGWFAVAWEGHKLGWIKGLGNRVNNYFPKEWRILSHEFIHGKTPQAGEEQA
jgi:16S rRNA C967 or C1407 C5-methylase (RsmB/RsmF family)/NOL1/NOP2/fmu family ribosome biogenesis protein